MLSSHLLPLYYPPNIESISLKMARKHWICPFCRRSYAKRSKLWAHLQLYNDTWRLPADGSHDVRQIDEILNHHSLAAHLNYDVGRQSLHSSGPPIPKEPFPFLQLPFELRWMTYTYILCFDSIVFYYHTDLRPLRISKGFSEPPSSMAPTQPSTEYPFVICSQSAGL
ncbi:hypothetical protein BDV59DRAFT_35279 [Aspergillus ambiguus]|uniref:uncharacterized protein n=1 Tax=Aspergillus ambiguus TaxID=176160 RepID=UPI003CCE0151